MSSFARFAIQLVASESAGPPWGGLYQAAVLRRIVAGCDDAVGLALRPLRRVVVPLRDGVAEGRSRHVVVVLVGQHPHAVGDEHVERRRLRRAAEGVGVGADEQRRTGDALAGAVVDDQRT